MASPSELSLDCKPQSYSILLKSFGDDHDQTRKLEEFLSRLEEERLKIDAFKRELPLCMQLLINAVEASRQQLQAYRANDHQGQKKPVLEEFIPIKQYANSEENHDQKAANISDKANWMTTAQLWCQTSSNTNEAGSNKQQQSTITSSAATGETDNTISFDIVSPKLNLDAKPRNGGAFLPFSKDRPSRGVTDLALIPSNNEKEIEDNKKCFEGDNDQGKAQIHTTTTEAQGATANTSTNSASGNGNQTHRKARRCWSPDLHRRFVNALQMLGGSQVATPKQIRELMKVDGLTNDEVKSHLQKYRLHTRRPSCPSPQPPGTPPPHQLVVLGGIWVPPEYATAAAAAAHNGGPTMTTLYSTAAHPVSHAPAHYFPPPVPSHHLPQDHHFYSIPNNSNSLPPPPGYHHGQLLHHQLHVYNSSSQNHSSPESDGRGKGDWSESIEDGTKSESSSWKGESGENRGERKGLAAFREDGEESNGSEITLKF